MTVVTKQIEETHGDGEKHGGTDKHRDTFPKSRSSNRKSSSSIRFKQIIQTVTLLKAKKKIRNKMRK